jgi:hypothetical protein
MEPKTGLSDKVSAFFLRIHGNEMEIKEVLMFYVSTGQHRL